MKRSVLAERVKYECLCANISQAEIARRLGMTPQAFHNMIMRGNPKATITIKIADELGVETGVLFQELTDKERMILDKN